MRIAVVTDAWAPQLNGVVTVLVELRERLLAMGHEVEVVEPSAFRTFGCPGYPEIRLAWAAGDRVARRLDAWAGDAIHIATEGPLGLAARAYCRRRDLPFTTAVHSRFPEFLRAACGLPANVGYALMRRFHAASLSPSETTSAPAPSRAKTRSTQVRSRTIRPGPRLALGVPGPVFLFVGRIAAEKNLEAFLRLDLPGSKVVVGGGPLLERYRRTYPKARWMGPVPRQSLVAFYAAADVFVHPSRTDTFGLVMLEAMACGTPVAAFPVAGPLDVVGASDGGVLDVDLRRAALRALEVPRERARARAEGFDRDRVAREFVAYLAPIARRDAALALPPLSRLA
jgi:glycosyltransferase involved in cell wall biosynthesis